MTGPDHSLVSVLLSWPCVIPVISSCLCFAVWQNFVLSKISPVMTSFFQYQCYTTIRGKKVRAFFKCSGTKCGDLVSCVPTNSIVVFSSQALWYQTHNPGDGRRGPSLAHYTNTGGCPTLKRVWPKSECSALSQDSPIPSPRSIIHKTHPFSISSPTLVSQSEYVFLLVFGICI